MGNGTDTKPKTEACRILASEGIEGHMIGHKVRGVMRLWAKGITKVDIEEMGVTGRLGNHNLIQEEWIAEFF